MNLGDGPVCDDDCECDRCTARAKSESDSRARQRHINEAAANEAARHRVTLVFAGTKVTFDDREDYE